MNSCCKAHHEKCFDIHVDQNLQITSTPIGPDFPSSAKLLFNRPINGLMPKVYRKLIYYNNIDDIIMFKTSQKKHIKNSNALKELLLHLHGIL